MRSKVKQWGNSLALCIPKDFAISAGLSPNTEVELQIVDGELHISPISHEKQLIESMVSQITPENQHKEVFFGRPVGNEGW
ncbi:MAG: AbrB/MazE/SpoVT family DNA-binding domain-containing protein [Thiobacillus sp.]